VIAATIVAVGLPGALAVGAYWADRAGPVAREAAAPHWLTFESVRATSSDGEAVKAKLALDVPEARTRELINSRYAQVSLLLQASVAGYEHGRDGGADRVQRLAAAVRGRLNDFLEEGGVPPVRDVVIQDLVFSRP
jgi:hypothetical protein